MQSTVQSAVQTGSLSFSVSSDPSFNNIKQESSGRVFASAPEPSTSTVDDEKAGFGIIRDKRMESYMGSIVARLMAHWHGDKPERVGVFVQSGSSVRAKATPSGDILIPIGAFDGMESEDQLAALIAHELGHIVLRHSDDDAQAKMIATIGQYAVMAAVAVSSYQNGGKRKLGDRTEFYIANQRAVQKTTLQAVAAQAALVTLTQDVLLTAYSRHQENVADAFGTRLAGHSGWDPRAMLTLIQGWHDAEVSEQKEMEAKVANSGLLESVLGSLGQIAATITASHPSAEARRETVLAELEKEFPDTAPKRPKTAAFIKAVGHRTFKSKRRLWRLVNRASKLNAEGKFEESLALVRNARKLRGAKHPDSRLVMAMAYEAQGAKEGIDTSYELLTSADLKQPATLSFYRKLIQVHAYRGNYSRAAQVADVAEDYHGTRVLPERINALHIESRTYKEKIPERISKSIAGYMAECRGVGDSALLEACEFANGRENTDAAAKVCGGVLNAIASFVDKSKNC